MCMCDFACTNTFSRHDCMLMLLLFFVSLLSPPSCSPKVISSYSTLESGTCNPQITAGDECFVAGTELGLKPVVRNMTVSSNAYPAGCSAVATAGGFEIVFNSMNASTTKVHPRTVLQPYVMFITRSRRHSSYALHV